MSLGESVAANPSLVPMSIMTPRVFSESMAEKPPRTSHGFETYPRYSYMAAGRVKREVYQKERQGLLPRAVPQSTSASTIGLGAIFQ
jgi:D-serine deaminase-like pyridoxal phosphate-dependent protein